MADNKIAAIFVELDALLDSRLGTLSKIDPKAVERVFKNDYYFKRTEDYFPGVKPEVFRDAYAKRNFETLMAFPVMTGIVPVIRDLVASYSVESITAPTISEVKLVVMTHPYELSDAEKQALLECLSYNLDGMCPVELTDLTHEELTPQHCSENYRDMVFYNFLEWASAQEQNIQSRRMPTVQVIVPAFQHIPLESEDIEDMKARGVSVFEVAQQALSPIAHFRFIDARFFSAISPHIYSSPVQTSPIQSP